MSVPNAERGDHEFNLGLLGVVVCRPGMRSIKAIEREVGYDPETKTRSIFHVLASLQRVISAEVIERVIYETHLEYAASAPEAKRFTLDQIGTAALKAGLIDLRKPCFDMLMVVIPPEPEETDPDSGNA